MDTIPDAALDQDGEANSGLSCPDCSGVLEVKRIAPDVLHFRCRIGHVYGSQELLRGKEEEVERRLWSAVATVEELSGLITDLLQAAPDAVDHVAASRRLETTRQLIEQLRELSESNHSMAAGSPQGPAE